MPDFSIDGLIRYFEMAYKVMGWTNPEENSYEYHAAKTLKQMKEAEDKMRNLILQLESENDNLERDYALILSQLNHANQITKDLIHSNLHKTIADRVKVYNSIYNLNLEVEIDVNIDGTFRFVYDCEPDIEDKPYLDNCLLQISGMVKLANNMIGGI